MKNIIHILLTNCLKVSFLGDIRENSLKQELNVP